MFRYFLSFILSFAFAIPALAHHSPGSSGAGLSVGSAETLPQGEVSLTFKADYTHYQVLSDAEVQAMTESVGLGHVHVDVIRESLLQTFNLAFGVTDFLQLEVDLMGRYRAVGAAEGHTHGDLSYGYHTFGDIAGETDTWISGKFQVLTGDSGKLALSAGLKLPTGKTDARSQEPPSPSNARILNLGLQPGSGSLDGSFGLAYSLLIADGWSLDADSRYTSRGSHETFRAGDRFDGGFSLGYRLLRTEDAFSLGGFLEANLVNLNRNQEEEDGVWADEDNTGGLTLFVSPGLRASMGKNFSGAISFQWPVVQEINVPQQKTDYKASLSLSTSF